MQDRGITWYAQDGDKMSPSFFNPLITRENTRSVVKFSKKHQGNRGTYQHNAENIDFLTNADSAANPNNAMIISHGTSREAKPRLSHWNLLPLTENLTRFASTGGRPPIASRLGASLTPGVWGELSFTPLIRSRSSAHKKRPAE